MNRSTNYMLLVLLLIIGGLFGASIHYILMPVFGDSLVHCINLGVLFGVISYFTTRIIHMKFKSLQKVNKDLAWDMEIDTLTGVFNRNSFDSALRKLQDVCVYSMAFIDIDDFKKFNDQYGHKIGDEVLIRVAKAIQSSIRNSDAVYRYGGEEFVVILRDCDKQNAWVISEKIRKSVSGIDMRACLNVSVSLGVSTYPDDGVGVEGIVEASDSALLLAKSLGKNRTHAYNPKIQYITNYYHGREHGKLNCWEYKNCGRQPGGENVDEFGICTASTDQTLDGIHEGKNCGRACWVNSGTYCKGQVQGTFEQKYMTCQVCDFYLMVEHEEGEQFRSPAELLGSSDTHRNS